MTPKKLHKICHEAAMQCPQFKGYDNDQYVGDKKFGKIPKGGYYEVIKFWKADHYLFSLGYCDALPEHVLEMFENFDKVVEQAVNQYFKEL